MIVHTYSEARQKLAALLDQAIRDGQFKIRRKDGQTFIIRPEAVAASALDEDGVDLGITTGEIAQFVREGRKTYETEQE